MAGELHACHSDTADDRLRAMTRKTNSEIASELGLDHTTVSRLRSGTRRPSVEVAERILDMYAKPAQFPGGMAAFSASGDEQVRFLTQLWGPPADAESLREATS